MTDEEARKKQQVELSNVNAVLTSPFGVNDITVRLNTVFANVKPTVSVLRSFIYINARDLSFSRSADGSHVAAFDVNSILFGDNGRPEYQRSQTASLKMTEAQYQRVLRDGVTYGFDVPMKKPGTYKFRTAVRDHESSRIGTAAQVITIPDLSKDRLTVSGMVLTGDGTGSNASAGDAAAISPANEDRNLIPGSRTFRQGTAITYGYAVYNARLDKTSRLTQLTSQVRMFRDGKLVYTGELAPLPATDQKDPRCLWGGGRLQLGPDFPAGEYVLQIVIEDKLANPKQSVSTEWIDFEVVK